MKNLNNNQTASGHKPIWAKTPLMQILLLISLIFGYIDPTFSQTNIFVGTGVTTPSVGTNPSSGANGASPYGYCTSSGAMGKKMQIIYTVGQINTAMIAAGYTPGASFINNITWDISSNTGNAASHLSYTIKMANVAQSQFATTGSAYVGASTTVWGPLTQAFPSSGTGFLVTFTLGTPFQWDGTSNLLVEVCYTATTPFILTTYGGCRRTTTVSNQIIYNGGAAINCATAAYATLVAAVPNVRLNVSPATPCAGAPAISTAGSATTCAGTPTTIGLTGLVGAAGYTYLWKQSATNGGPYVAASGANTNSTYTTPASLPFNPTYYICEVTCSNSSLMTPSNQGTVSLANFLTCYCTTNFSSAAATTARGLTNVTLNGNSININNTTAANTANPSPYNLYATPIANITSGLTYTLSTAVGTATNNLHYVTAWIDYDKDGQFGGYTNLGVANVNGDYGVGGAILERIISVGPTTNVTTNTGFTVPFSATSGNTAMRVRYRYGASNATVGACVQYTGAATTGGAGEVEDYRVTIIPGCVVPTVGASASSASNLQPTTADLSWTSGNGSAGRIILLRQGGAVNSIPVSGTSYTANATFGSGDQIGVGNYVVYKNTGASTTINGLLPSTTYHYSIFEYNTASTCYILTGHTGSFTTGSCSPTVQPSGATTCSEYTSLNLTFNRGNGDRTLVVARAGSAVNADPVYNTNYTANAAFGSGDQIGTGNFVIYNGNNPVSATVNLTNLTQGTVYHFKLYEYFESPNCYNLSSVPSPAAITRNAGVYTSSTTSQNTATVAQNSLAQQVIGLQVVMGGGADPAATINSITFNTAGTTNTATDIVNAKIFYTGTSATFSNATQYGSTFTSFAGNLTATDNFALLPGTNYFWIAYDMKLNATVSNVIDAQIVSFSLTDNSGTSVKIPSVTAPAGSRSIISSAPSGYCIPSPAVEAVGDYITAPTWSGGDLGAPHTYGGGTNSGSGVINKTAQAAPTLTPGVTYNLSYYAEDFIGNTNSVWIDWDQSGTWNTTAPELVRNSGASFTVTQSVTVPLTATPGATRMRIINRFPSAGTNACVTSNGSSTSAVYVDYNVIIAGAVGVQAVSCVTPVPTITTPVTYAKNDVASQLTATGTNLLWYTAATGGVGNATAPTPSTLAAGTTAYYVTQNTGCEGPRIQIAVNVTTTCGPIAYVVTGGNNCYSTTVGLANSESGVNYQLHLDGSPVGSPVAGTGSSISFGAQTISGLYTVVGTDAQPASTNMIGNARVYVNPTAVVSGSLLGCSPAGVTLGIVGSLAGSGFITGRQWQENSIDIPLATGITYNALVSNNYSVIITNSNGCSTTSASSAVVINTPPSVSGSGVLETCENGAIVVSGVTAADGALSWVITTGNGSIANTGTLSPTYTPDVTDVGTVVVLTLTVSNPPCANAILNQQIYIRPRPVLNPASVNICTGNPTQQIDIVSPQPNTDYKWSPPNDLYLDAALTTPYTLGTPATSVWTAPFGGITYSVTATNTLDNCETGTSTVAVTVCPALTNGICDADIAPPINVTTTPTFNLYSLTGATVSGGVSCAPIARDIWYRAQVPANGELHVITALHNNPTAALNIQSSVVTIFTGPNCSSVASVNCNSNGAAGNMSYAHAYGLTPGSFAYIRLGSTVAGNAVAAQFIKMAVTSGLIWTAAADNDFNNPANWHGGDATAITKPDANKSAIIQHSVAQPKLYLNSNVKGMHFTTSPPYFVSLGINLNAFTLNVKGNWFVGPSVNSSLVVDCNGLVEFNGNGAATQTIGGKTTFGNLTTNNTVAGVTLTGTTGVSCILSTTAGNFNSAGFLVLRSTATSTALVNPMAGNIIGNVSVERKIGTLSGYHYLSSPVLGAMINNTVNGWRDDFTILSSLDGIAFIPGNTYSLLPSVWEYNESNLNPNPAYGWISATAGDDPIAPLKGFACVVSANTVVDVLGPLNNGTIAGGYNITKTPGTGIGEGLNTIGNPYASPISWNAFRALTGNNTLLSSSGYQAFISSGGYNGTYGSWDGSIGSPISVTDKIASSQGIMVTALASGTINAANSVRLTSALDLDATFFNGYNSVPDLLRLEVQGNGFTNETAIYFDPTGADVYDLNRDARLIYTPVAGVPNIYSNIDNTPLNINVMGPLNLDKVVPLGVKIQTAGTYNLVATDMTTFAPSAIAYLEDTQSGTMTNLRSNPSYPVTLPVGEFNNRFFIHFHPAVELNAINETCAGNDGKLILNYPATNTVNMVIKDEIGNVVSTQNNFTGTVTINNLAAGNYIVEMVFGVAPNTYSTSDYFTIAEGNAVYANLSASANTVDMNVSTAVNFTATAQGATSFNWNFGDGTIITNGPANVSHTYTQAGTYTVTFEASNGICSAVANTTVEVTNATGLTSVSNSNLQVAGVGSKVTVRFGNKMEGTGNIEIINMLGEIVAHLDNVSMKGTKEIELSNIATGQYLVKITNNTQLFTEKVYLNRQ